MVSNNKHVNNDICNIKTLNIQQRVTIDYKAIIYIETIIVVGMSSFVVFAN
jgi:hypothetical protein